MSRGYQPNNTSNVLPINIFNADIRKAPDSGEDQLCCANRKYVITYDAQGKYHVLHESLDTAWQVGLSDNQDFSSCTWPPSVS